MRNSGIAWTHHTLSMWWGCVHVSPGCDNCYADGQAHHALPPGWIIIGEGREAPRLTKAGDKERPEIWGADAPRIFPPPRSPVFTDPLKWDRAAAKAGERHRIFCSSMCDLFERHRRAEINDAMDRGRARLFGEIIPACINLDFLFLTKRPHDIKRLVPSTWLTNWPVNVWVGTTVESQQYAAQRLPHLLAIPAPVRFVSGEPLLGPLDLTPWLEGLDWVICGGESGHKRHIRPMQVAWARALRDQTVKAGRAFFFKQWGNWTPADGEQLVYLRTKDSSLLDGREWEQFPVPRLDRNESPPIATATVAPPQLPQPKLAPASGNLPSPPMPDPFAHVVSLRRLCDKHALRLADGERSIRTLNQAFARTVSTYIHQRVDLERAQCEMLLALEQDVPHGYRTTWKAELAGSLCDARHLLGRTYSVSGIETRLTVARRAAEDPSVWARAIVLAHDANGVLNLRKLVAKTEPAEEEEGKPAEKAPKVALLESQAEEDLSVEGAAQHLEAADAVLDVLAIDEHAPDALDQAKVLREHAALYPEVVRENERLRAENERLRVEVAALRSQRNGAAITGVDPAIEEFVSLVAPR